MSIFVVIEVAKPMGVIIGITINPIPKTLKVIDVDVVPTITILSSVFKNLFIFLNLLYFFYFCYFVVHNITSLNL